VEAEKILLNAAAFGNPGGDHQRHGASHTDKAGEQKRRGVAASERTKSGERAPNSESTENKIGAGRLQGTETEGGPDGKRQTKESEAVPLRPQKRGRTENKDTQKAESGEEKKQFEKLAERGPVARGSEDEDEKGSEGNRAESVANPPGKPDNAKIVPTGEAGAADDADTNGGADGRSNKTGEANKAEDVFGPVEGFGAVSELIDEVSADKSLEGVADSDASGDDDGGIDVIIDKKGANQDGGPNAISEKKKSSDGDARRSPKNGGMWIDAGHTETEPAGSVIDKGEQGKDSEVGKERRL
jgi:hypothetical protein